MSPIKVLMLAAVAVVFATPTLAQKSKDTIRLAINDPFTILSSYCVPVDEVGNFTRGVYGTLISVDEHKQQFVPELAKSWKRLDPSTLEFELRDDITFHNGNKFDADDVVSTINWLKDPKTQIQYKTRYSWVKTVEKLGPHRIRIVANDPLATDMQSLAYRVRIQDAESFNSLADKCDYGRLTPYGTGPYKLASIDRNQGVVVERYDNFKGDPAYFRAGVKRIHGIPIPDRQTQVAQLITGGVDILRNVSPDNARELAKQPNLGVSVLPTGSFYYIVLDAAGRSGHKATVDPRVRKAIFMALDRDTIIKHIVPGGDVGVAEKMKGFCFSYNVACKYSTTWPDYDPDGAKKLLAEAGYPDGFDITYDVFIPVRAIGEAIAGELRKVGIRAGVNPVTINVFYKRWSGGEENMVSVFFPTSSFPDTGNVLDTFFGAERDYARDPIIHKAMADGEREFDVAKRAAIYEVALNRIAEMNYAMAFSSLPTVYAHSKDVEIKRSPLSAGDYYITEYHWK